MPLHVSSKSAHHQEVKIALHSLWYHHTYRWPSLAQVERGLSQPVHETATYRCDDTRGCVMQFWPPDDGHFCSKHVEAWNKLIVKQKFCASSWFITELNPSWCRNHITETGFDEVEWIHMVLTSDQWRTLLNMVLPVTSATHDVFLTERSLVPQEGIYFIRLVSLRLRTEM